MPRYDLKCTECGAEQQVMLGLSEMSEKIDAGRDDINLKESGVRCKCGSTHFRKLVSVTARMSHNWASWQRKK